MRNLVTLAALCATSSAFAQSTVLISADDQGHMRDCEGFFGVSADGRYVLLSSLVVLDRMTGANDIVNAPPGSPYGISGVDDADWSADRRWIAFLSTDSALIPGDNNSAADVLLRDGQTGLFELISQNLAGVPGNGDCWSVRVSDDGRFVTFGSAASDMVLGDTNNQSDVFLRDRQAGTTSRISLLANGTESQSFVGLADMTGDARYVVLLGETGLASGVPSSPFRHVVRKDLGTGATVLVDVATNGAPGNFLSLEAHLSSDGRWVSFFSLSSDLVNGDQNQYADTFVRDLQNATTTLASRTPAGTPGDLGSTFTCPISPDGRFVAFRSDSTDLVPGDTNGQTDCFLFDRQTAVVERVSVHSDGTQAGLGGAFTDHANLMSVSGDGRLVFFATGFDDVVVGGTLGSPQMRGYLRDRASPCAPITAYCTAKVNSAGCTPLIGATGEPRRTGSDAFFVWAGEVRWGPVGTLLWSLQPASTPFGGGTLCVASPFVRTAAQSATLFPFGTPVCHGEYAFHFTQAYFAQHGLAAGTTVRCQYFGRDNGFASPGNVTLSDALVFTVGP